MSQSNKRGYAALYDISERKKQEQKKDSSTRVLESQSANLETPPIIEEKPSPTTLVPEYQGGLVPQSNFYRKSNETVDSLDRTLTPAESKVLDHLLRLTIGFNTDRRQIRVSKLKERTGYSSAKTVRIALFGLISKGIIKKISRNNDPLGDEYIILDRSSTRVPDHSSTRVESSGVLESNSTRQLNTSIKDKRIDDDDAALAGLNKTLKQAAKEITGREPSPTESERWKELAEVLVMEAKIAAARTTVSSLPAFLAEHLRRRLWKKDKAQLASEQTEAPQMPAAQALTEEQIKACPDCGGSTWYYPEGPEKGIKRCRHEKLTKQAENGE
ncbi:MAG TPA: hypothetical protein VF543_22285 [Pyrinomonadaceae bacterium]|jgi:hypothetical protein